MSATGDTGRSKSEPIHFWSGKLGYDAPTFCGKTDVPKPTTPEWRYVDCPACLAKKPVKSGPPSRHPNESTGDFCRRVADWAGVADEQKTQEDR